MVIKLRILSVVAHGDQLHSSWSQAIEYLRLTSEA